MGVTIIERIRAFFGRTKPAVPPVPDDVIEVGSDGTIRQTVSWTVIRDPSGEY